MYITHTLIPKQPCVISNQCSATIYGHSNELWNDEIVICYSPNYTLQVFILVADLLLIIVFSKWVIRSTMTILKVNAVFKQLAILCFLFIDMACLINMWCSILLYSAEGAALLKVIQERRL